VVVEPRGRRQHRRGAGDWCGASGRRGPRWHSSSSGDEGVAAVALKRSWHGGGDSGEGVPAWKWRRRRWGLDSGDDNGVPAAAACAPVASLPAVWRQ
jgi:hypothetical protein